MRLPSAFSRPGRMTRCSTMMPSDLSGAPNHPSGPPPGAAAKRSLAAWLTCVRRWRSATPFPQSQPVRFGVRGFLRRPPNFELAGSYGSSSRISEALAGLVVHFGRNWHSVGAWIRQAAILEQPCITVDFPCKSWPAAARRHKPSDSGIASRLRCRARASCKRPNVGTEAEHRSGRGTECRWPIRSRSRPVVVPKTCAEAVSENRLVRRMDLSGQVSQHRRPGDFELGVEQAALRRL